LVINGIAGDYSDKLVSGAFKVSSFGLETQDSSSQVQGSGASPTGFYPLSLAIDSEALAGVLAAATGGSTIKDVSLIGEATVDGKSAITYSLNLADVTVGDVGQIGGEGFLLSLDYDKIGLVTKGVGPDGSLQSSESFGWNTATNQSTQPGTSVTNSGSPA